MIAGNVLCRGFRPFIIISSCKASLRPAASHNLTSSCHDSTASRYLYSYSVAGHSHHGDPQSVEVSYLASHVRLSCWYLDCSSIHSTIREGVRAGSQQQQQRQTRIPNTPLSARQSARGQNSVLEGIWTMSRELLMFKTETRLMG